MCRKGRGALEPVQADKEFVCNFKRGMKLFQLQIKIGHTLPDPFLSPLFVEGGRQNPHIR